MTPVIDKDKSSRCHEPGILTVTTTNNQAALDLFVGVSGNSYASIDRYRFYIYMPYVIISAWSIILWFSTLLPPPQPCNPAIFHQLIAQNDGFTKAVTCLTVLYITMPLLYTNSSMDKKKASRHIMTLEAFCSIKNAIVDNFCMEYHSLRDLLMRGYHCFL